MKRTVVKTSPPPRTAKVEKHDEMPAMAVPPKKESHWPSRFKALFWFVAGTLVGPFILQWFVAFLPGPNLRASVHGMRPMAGTGNAVGGIYYALQFETDDPVEYVYAKFQFPATINNYKVGHPQEAEVPEVGRTTVQAFELGTNANGQHVVVQSFVNNNVDVQASAAGNMMSISASKLPNKGIIIGMVATTEGKSQINPAPKIYMEGAYEYIKMGVTVRKRLKVIDEGIKDLK